MATSAEDMEAGFSPDSRSDDKLLASANALSIAQGISIEEAIEKLNRQQETLLFYEESLRRESAQKKRELHEQSQELLDINVSKAHIAKRRHILTAFKADPNDFEVLSKKLTEWIELSEAEARNDDIATKWENVIETYRLSLGQWNVAAVSHGIINPLVRQYNSLKKLAAPLLNSYRKKVEDVKDVEPVRRKTV